MKNGFCLLSTFLTILFICYSVQAKIGQEFLQQDNRLLDANRVHSSIGPFEIYSSDSTSSIRFQFAGQLRLTLDSRDKGSNDDRTNELSMRARSIRLTLNGIIYNPDLSYKLHLSAAPKSLELMDFFFNYKLKSNLQFRFGQYKTPFTRYRIQSVQRLVFVDLAIVTKYFGAERQMGFALHNGYEKPPQWGYIFGVFSGANARASHALGLSKVYGEDAVNPSDLSNPGTIGKFHPELFLHMTYNANNIKINSNSDAAKTGLRYSVGTSLSWDLDPTPYQDFSLRIAPEFLVKYRGLSIFAVGYAGYSKIGDPLKIRLAMTGGLFQTAYRINPTYEISLRYVLVDFDDKLTDDAHERALELITDSGNDPDVLEQYKNAGLVSKEQEVTLGLNLYILGHKLKWQSDFGWLRHSFIDEDRDDYLIRSQFQLAF